MLQQRARGDERQVERLLSGGVAGHETRLLLLEPLVALGEPRDERRDGRRQVDRLPRRAERHRLDQLARTLTFEIEAAQRLDAVT